MLEYPPGKSLMSGFTFVCPTRNLFYKRTHFTIYAGKRRAVRMSSDDVIAKSIGYAEGVIDSLDSIAIDVGRRISQPGVIRVSRREQRPRRDHCA